MQTLLKKRIVVLGSYGEFTRRVATELVAMPQVECILGLPPSGNSTAFASRIGAPFMVLDPNVPSALQRLLEGTFAVVNLRGPFTGREHLVVAARCASLGVHYIDPADSRQYIGEFAQLARDAREHDALLVTGAGAAPAVTAALAELLSKEFDRAREIHVFLTPGMADDRELAAVRSIIDRPAASVRVKERGRWRKKQWSAKPAVIGFPEPIGRRRGWLCELPDLDLLAEKFDVGTITARTGFAPGLLNFVTSILAMLHRRGALKRLTPLAGWLLRTSARLSNTNGRPAAVRVSMSGVHGGAEQEHVVSLVARDEAGPAIAAAPILALIRKWVHQGVDASGAVPCVGLLALDDLRPELASHNIVMVRE